MMKTERPYAVMTKAEREDFTKALIEEVKLHPAIWQMESGFYRDNSKKARAWHEIALTLGQTEHTCQTTWKNARAYYSKIKREKSRRREDLLEDATPESECYWVHFKAMDFLAPYVDDRAGKSRRRENASDDGDFLASYCGLSCSGQEGMEQLLSAAATGECGETGGKDSELLLVNGGGPGLMRSATSTPSSAAAPGSEPCGSGGVKRRREGSPSPAQSSFLDFGRFDAYVDAVVTKGGLKKLLAAGSSLRPLSPGAAFGQFLGVVLDALPEPERNDKILALLSTLHKPPL